MQEIENLIKKLGTGATSQSEAMKCYDHIHGTIYEMGRHKKNGDFPRMIFEGFIDGIVEELEVIETKLPKWLPIEEAPKDGTAILVTHKDGDIRTIKRVWWGKIKLVNGHKQDGWKLSNNKFLQYIPTHFMPLPPLPVKD